MSKIVMKKKRVVRKWCGILGMTLFLFIYGMSLVSGNVFDVLSGARTLFFGEDNLVTGMATSRTTNVTVTVGNAAPVVNAITNDNGTSVVAQSVTEDGIVQLGINFTASDVDGITDMDNTTANLTLMKAAGVWGDQVNNESVNTSCYADHAIDADTLSFVCVVQIHYWFDSGEWNLTAGIQDTSGLAAVNSTNFTISSTTAVVISPTSVSFGSLSIGDENTTGTNIEVNNTANAGVTTVNVNAIDLIGEVTITDSINAGNFSIDIDTGGSPPAECTAATQMVNATNTAVASATLAAGNRSAGEGNETLYPCLRIVPAGISAQAYSTLNGTAWTVAI